MKLTFKNVYLNEINDIHILIAHRTILQTTDSNPTQTII